MAHWLARAKPRAYGIEDDARGHYDLVLWTDGAVTRTDPGRPVPANAQRLYQCVPGCDVFGFVTVQDDRRLKLHEQPLSFIPFSTYDLGEREPQALAIHYTPPDRKNGTRQRLTGLAPRGMRLVADAVRGAKQEFIMIGRTAKGEALQERLEEAPTYGRLLRTRIVADGCRLKAQ